MDYDYDDDYCNSRQYCYSRGCGYHGDRSSSPPCFICGQPAFYICTHPLCKQPPVYCYSDECINKLAQKLHRHDPSSRRDSYVTVRHFEQRMKNIQENTRSDIYYQYFSGLQKEILKFKNRFKSVLDVHRRKIQNEYQIEPSEECKEVYNRFKSKSYQYSTGREVGILMSQNGIVYKNKETSQRLIQLEKKRFTNILEEIKRIFQEYIHSPSLQDEQQKGESIMISANELLAEEKWQEALQQLIQAQKHLMLKEKIHVDLGNCYKHVGKLSQAKEWYIKALELTPKHVEALLNVAEICDVQKSYDQSIDYYDRLIEIDKHQPEYYSKRGLIYVKQKDLKSAIVDFTKACKLSPNNQTYHEFKRKAMVDLAYGDGEDSDD